MDETYHNLPVQITALGAASKLRSTSSTTTNNSHVERERSTYQDYQLYYLA